VAFEPPLERVDGALLEKGHRGVSAVGLDATAAVDVGLERAFQVEPGLLQVHGFGLMPKAVKTLGESVRPESFVGAPEPHVSGWERGCSAVSDLEAGVVRSHHGAPW